MERRIVDPNSVQTQFATLNRDRDAYQNAAKAADYQRINEEKILRNLRSTQTELLEKLRFAHSKLGEEDKKRNILREEEARLKKSLKEDKHEIIRLTSEVDGMESEEKTQKKSFVKEIDRLNIDLDKELKIYREKLAMKDITVKNLRILLNTKMLEEMKWEEEQQQNQGGGSDHQNKWRNLSEKLNQSLEIFQDSTDKYKNEMNTLKSFESEKHMMRTKMITNGSAKDEPLGDMELDELERLWEEASQTDTMGSISGKNDNACHNNYNDNNQQEGEERHDRHHQLPQAVVTAQQQEHINMSLFYGNNNNDNDSVSMEY